MQPRASHGLSLEEYPSPSIPFLQLIHFFDNKGLKTYALRY